MDRNRFSRSNFNRLATMALVFALAWALLPDPALAQAESPEKPKREKLFKSAEVMNITLQAPWREVIKEKKNQDPYPAKLNYTDKLGQTHSIPATVQRRGFSRQEVCKFPPIRLRFNREDVKDTIFRGQQSLKLVTHCNRGQRWEQYYVKEYAIYQMYREITDMSFRARPLSVTYIENADDSSEDAHFAFLVEDDSDVAKRNDTKKLELLKVSPRQLQPEQATRLALFEYIIANVDFDQTAGTKSGQCCHNSRLFGLDPNANIYIVPYDFDSSGLVDSDYAAPHPSLPIKRVTQRLYRGFCVHNPSLEAVRQEFLAKEQALYTIVSSTSLLSEQSGDNMLDFLQDSFAILRDNEKFDKQIIRKCRK
jgi:hypothetical protein